MNSSQVQGEQISEQNLANFIWHFLKNRKLFLGPFIFLAMFSGLWSPINNVLLKYIIDALASTNLEQSYALIVWPAVLLVINFEVHSLCWRGMNYLNLKFQLLIKNDVITQTFSYLHQHAHQFFQDNPAGKILNHITTLADNIERIVHDISRHIFRGVVLLIVSFISMYYVHAAFFYTLLGWFIIFISFSLYMSNKLINLSEEYAATESVVSGKLIDSISNSSSVRLFARYEYEKSFLLKALELTKKSFQKKEKFAIVMHLLQGFSLSSLLAAMLYFLIQLRTKGMVSIGDFALIMGLTLEVGFITWWTCEQIDELNKSIGKCKQSINTIFKPLKIKDRAQASILQVTNGQIVFENVNFSYQETTPLFVNKSVVLPAGQKVGLVGYSGGGKSTFVNLIMRLYDIASGRIMIDGQEIGTVTQASLHSNIAIIPQEPALFHRTLMENIRYGNNKATDQEVIAAAKKAHAHDFIVKLPQRYDSLVGDRGVKLSGGERQRIAIARAILKNAPILILDEATSQLDSITENIIQESLWQLMQGKTTIVIAHRLSTLLHMDRILVFDNGAIVGDGSHDELLQQNLLYKTLWDNQVGGFLPEKKY